MLRYPYLINHGTLSLACGRNSDDRKAGVWRQWFVASGRQGGPHALRAAGRSGARGNRAREERSGARPVARSAAAIALARDVGMPVFPALRRLPVPTHRLRVPVGTET